MKPANTRDEYPTTDQTANAVFRFVVNYIAIKGYPPNRREIQSGCYISKHAMMRALGYLEGKGIIRVDVATARGISVSPNIG